jgi:hypothetical protein
VRCWANTVAWPDFSGVANTQSLKLDHRVEM